MKDRWVSEPLSDIADIIMGQSPPSSTYNQEGSGLPFFQGKAEFGEIYPTIAKYCSKPLRIAEKNDILMTVRAPVGPVNLSPTKCCIGRGLSAIRGKTHKIDRMYLFYFLRSIESRLSKLGQGSTFGAIGRRDLERIVVPRPVDIEVQHRIALVLQKTHALRQKRERANQLTGKIIQSVFLKMFGDPNNIQLDFQKEPLDDLVDNLDSKRVPLNEEQRSKRRGNVPYYGASGLVDWVDESLFDEPLLLVAEDGENLRSRKLPIAYSIFGKSWVNNHAHVLRCLRINQRYLEVWFNILDISAHLGGSTRPKLNKTTLMSMKVPVPPIDLQQKFAAIVEGIHRLKERQTESNQEINELFGSLISKAFRGELLATDGIERPTLESRKNGQTLDKYVA